MSPQSPRKLPVFRQNYEGPTGKPPPVPLRERLKTLLLAVSVVVAGVWLQAHWAESSDRRALALMSLGIGLTLAGSVQLVALADSPDRDRIFTKNKRQAYVGFAAMTAAGVAMIVAGMINGA